MLTFRATLLASLLGPFCAACGDRCLAYDYRPPSARITLRDAATGELLCSPAVVLVTTSRGTPTPHEDTCEWWLPEWLPGDAGAGASEAELVVTVSGYQPQALSVEVTRNECGEIQQPALLQVDVQPAADE